MRQGYLLGITPWFSRCTAHVLQSIGRECPTFFEKHIRRTYFASSKYIAVLTLIRGRWLLQRCTRPGRPGSTGRLQDAITRGHSSQTPKWISWPKHLPGIGLHTTCVVPMTYYFHVSVVIVVVRGIFVGTPAEPGTILLYTVFGGVEPTLLKIQKEITIIIWFIITSQFACHITL